MSIISFGLDPDVGVLENSMNRLFDDFIKDLNVTKRGGRVSRSNRESLWTPLIDVHETDKELVISTELPGLTKEQIDVGIVDNVLKIQGEIKKEQENKGLSHIQERRWGKFTRTLALPNNLKTDNVEAKFENGVLELKIPKSESTSQKISIE